jgi:hypothetical protein
VSSWQVKENISSAFESSTVYSGDADTDLDDGFKNGVHDVTLYDWQQYLDFDDLHLPNQWAFLLYD